MLESFVLVFAQEPTVRGASWLDTVRSGGPIGYIIIGLSVIAFALMIMHLVQLRRSSLMSPVQIDAIDSMLARGDVKGAIEYCVDPKNDSYLTRILSQGLTRYQQSAFGVFEIKNAVEEAGEDQTARLYRSTDALGVIGQIAPLLGLLGTVFGMVGAFEAISRSAGSQHEELARNISMALVTTLMGLVLAIPCISLFTFFRNRIDAFASEAALEIERLVLHLESGAGAGGSPMSKSTTTGSGPMAAGAGARPAAVGDVGTGAGGGGSVTGTRS